MAQSDAIRRLRKEYTSLLKEPALGIYAKPLETNFLHAHFLLHGEVFYDTPYEGGVYHGVLKFPSNYPMKPPTVIMRTPSGRFQPDQKICFSMSDFHPELWNPMWSTRSILTGLVSFMNSEDITTGGVKAAESTRIASAKESLKYCIEKDELALELFRNELEGIVTERTALQGDADVNNIWPPKRPAPKESENPTVDEVPVRRRRIRNVTRLGDKPKVDGGGTTKSSDVAQQENSAQDALSSTASSSNKNVAKNKKKREKEKRKKLVFKFMSDLSERVPVFVQSIQARLLANGMDVTKLDADHVCWRNETVEEYTDLVTALRAAVDECTLLVESNVGGRPIATFQLTKPIQCENRTIGVIEIPAPKDGSVYRSGLEHVEFVIAGDRCDQPSSPVNDALHQSQLSDLMQTYPGLEWNEKAKDKEVNPDVSVKVELEDFGICSVKFHLISLADVIKFELSERS